MLHPLNQLKIFNGLDERIFAVSVIKGKMLPQRFPARSWPSSDAKYTPTAKAYCTVLVLQALRCLGVSSLFDSESGSSPFLHFKILCFSADRTKDV